MACLPGDKAGARGASLAGADRKSRVTVTIVGEDYTLRADADPEYIKLLARSVDERVRAALATNPRLSRSQATILACLAITDELHRLKASYDELVRFVEDAR